MALASFGAQMQRCKPAPLPQGLLNQMQSLRHVLVSRAVTTPPVPLRRFRSASARSRSARNA
jgi:hypothetical protein